MIIVLNIDRDSSGTRQDSVNKALDGTDGDVNCESFSVCKYDHNIYVNETIICKRGLVTS